MDKNNSTFTSRALAIKMVSPKFIEKCESAIYSSKREESDQTHQRKYNLYKTSQWSSAIELKNHYCSPTLR